jgi:hypothetical protein
MVDEEDQHVEDTFDAFVSVTEKSGNLSKDLKKDILKNIRILRKVFYKMKTQIENKSGENKKLRDEVMKVTEEMARMRDGQPARHEAPFLDHMQQTVRHGAQQVPPSEGRKGKLFSEALKDEGDKQYKITLKAKDNSQSLEQIKLQLKKNINPTEIKVRIKTLKTLQDEGIIIETGSKEEIYSLSSAISAKCGEQLEIIKHKLRKPRLIIYNISEDITTENAPAIIKAQNPEITLNGEDITAKFRYKTRKGN